MESSSPGTADASLTAAFSSLAVRLAGLGGSLTEEPWSCGHPSLALGVGHKGIYGDARYDIAKLRHSACGLYDVLVADSVCTFGN